MSNEKSLYIGGKIVEGSAVYSITNPATMETVASINGASEKDVQLALECAQNAFSAWSTTSVENRIEWMMKLKNALIDNEQPLREAVHLEMGKSWASTHDDYSMLIDSLDYYAKLIKEKALLDESQSVADYQHQITRTPIGVAAAFLAWNFPLLNIAYKVGPAMAAGCPLIIKPSQKTSLSACVFGEICKSIDLPNGVINIVCGDDQLVGDTISASTIPALISLIGSASVGKHVIKTGATSIKRYSMELGGNAPVIVLDDADLDLASDIVATMKTANAGQICVTPNRVFVHSTVHDEFVALVKRKLENVKVGFDKSQDIDMGPLIDMQAWERIDKTVKEAVSEGAVLELGGDRPVGLDKGAFYAPTLLTKVSKDMSIYKNEVFGPVVSIIAFSELNKVIEAANDTEAGLSSFIFSKNKEVASNIAKQLAFGEVHVNGICYAINLPHCGLKQSGTGIDCSEFALDEYFAVKRVSTAL
ncbi:aldehyde dehydrogenase family protein [Glaciecola sp. 2405UD65-10]|uniref:aldehyde dehydrogenase family protein n=1 Tax=Glaciecola sp. 2405UD65-10 TaxID=3397244 RepID=UPI003B59544A